jgi:hypothetical protein
MLQPQQPQQAHQNQLRQQFCETSHSQTVTSGSSAESLIGSLPQEAIEDGAREMPLPRSSDPSPDHHSDVQWDSRGAYPWSSQAPQQDTGAAVIPWGIGDTGTGQSIESAVPAWSGASRCNSSQNSPQDSSNIRQSLAPSTRFPNDTIVQDGVSLPSISAGGSIRRQQQLQHSNSWPAEVDEASLLPWLDSYFKRLSPIAPVLSHVSLYEAMLLGRHRTNRDFGAMILAICSLVMIQSVYSEESAQLDQRTVTARSWMQHSAYMRSTWDFGQDPTIETILTSFFLFGCLFSDGQQRAAWHHLRLAVDMSCQIGLDKPDLYAPRSKQEMEQRLRIYLTLAVTERYGHQVLLQVNF